MSVLRFLWVSGRVDSAVNIIYIYILVYKKLKIIINNKLSPAHLVEGPLRLPAKLVRVTDALPQLERQMPMRHVQIHHVQLVRVHCVAAVQLDQ